MFTAFKELTLGIEEGKSLKAIALPGHTKGTTGYAVGDIIFCGDAIMGERANVENLGDELNSLARLAVFETIYPGHKKIPIEGHDICKISEYLTGKCEEVLKLAVGGITLRALEGLYGEITEKNFAKRMVPIKQVISYLHYLESKGQVQNRDGRWWKT
jgi:glyoxylase-like metal-dependent hydrolase (beta-lactamase superfamily II)